MERSSNDDSNSSDVPVSMGAREQLAFAGDGNEPDNQPTRDDGLSSRVGAITDDDSLVNADDVITNFEKLGALRLRGGTSYQYERIFLRFASAVSLNRYSKRQLAGLKGKELLLRYLLEKVPVPSRRTACAALKCIWEEGLKIPFPIVRRELGELPEVGRRQSPRDADVMPWIGAISREEDPYLRTLVLFIFQLGIRPSHACLFRWSHTKYGPDGKPEAIITTGREAGNKKFTPVKARLPQDLADALAELKKVVPDALPEDTILPRHKRNGQLVRGRMTSQQFAYQWERFQKKHLLSHLRPVDLRHWTSTICRRAGLSYAATNALQGHKCSSQNLRDRYDNPEDDELLLEQGTTLPGGPCGYLMPKLEVDQALPVELTQALSKTLSGEMLPSQFVENITAYLTRQLKKPANTMVA